MSQEHLIPDQPFKMVLGMENADRLLRATGREALSSLMKDETRGICMMNGSIIPLVYLCAGAIQHNIQISEIAMNMTMIVPTKDPEGNIVLTPDKDVTVPNITVIKDIADQLHVLNSLLLHYPGKNISLFAPVSKESTPHFHSDELIPARVFTVETVKNKWIAGSCGMDEGVLCHGDVAKQSYLNALQRCCRVGVNTNGFRNYEERVSFFENMLLPWISTEDPLFKLMVDLEIAKASGDPQKVLSLSENIFPVIEELLSRNPLLEDPTAQSQVCSDLA